MSCGCHCCRRRRGIVATAIPSIMKVCIYDPSASSSSSFASNMRMCIICNICIVMDSSFSHAAMFHDDFRPVLEATWPPCLWRWLELVVDPWYSLDAIVLLVGASCCWDRHATTHASDPVGNDEVRLRTGGSPASDPAGNDKVRLRTGGVHSIEPKRNDEVESGPRLLVGPVTKGNDEVKPGLLLLIGAFCCCPCLEMSGDPATMV